MCTGAILDAQRVVRLLLRTLPWATGRVAVVARSAIGSLAADVCRGQIAVAPAALKRTTLLSLALVTATRLVIGRSAHRQQPSHGKKSAITTVSAPRDRGEIFKKNMIQHFVMSSARRKRILSRSIPQAYGSSGRCGKPSAAHYVRKT
jgi:hypothetical protein